VFHDGEVMEDTYTLMDVAYMFEWDRVSHRRNLNIMVYFIYLGSLAFYFFS